MKKIILSVITFAIAGGLLISQTACEKEGSSSSNISTTNGNRSHNMGQNCMSCHKSGGQGDGWFTAAGTMYQADLVKIGRAHV